jgi:hypothetical protein
MSGFRMIRVDTSGHSIYTCEEAIIEYAPKLKYRIEKKNAFDPTILHQRESYREDTISLEIIQLPEEFNAFTYFLTQEGKFYIEFIMIGTLVKQFPVIVTQYPKAADEIREDPEKVKVTLQSSYIGSPGFINFDTYTTMDDFESMFE